MGAIRNMNWTRLVPAFIVADYTETDSQVTKIRLLIGEGVHSLLPTRGVAFNFGATPVFILGAQPAPDSPGGAVPHLASATDPGHLVIRVVRAMVA
jgi:hypothetical protein